MYQQDPTNSIVGWIEDINNGALHQIDTIYRNKQSDCIAQDLVESGVLPIYGLPSSQREFYHGFEQDSDGEYEYKSISRSLEESISELQKEF